eukprot:7795151-Lingulodinium_polyedra.AAC.1
MSHIFTTGLSTEGQEGSLTTPFLLLLVKCRAIRRRYFSITSSGTRRPGTRSSSPDCDEAVVDSGSEWSSTE